MNKLIRNLFLLTIAALLLSPVLINIGRAGMLTSNSTIMLDDPNGPCPIPEMVPNVPSYILVDEDPNDPCPISE